MLHKIHSQFKQSDTYVLEAAARVRKMRWYFLYHSDANT